MGIPFTANFRLNLDHFLNSTNPVSLKYLIVILIILLLKVPVESKAQTITPMVNASWSADLEINQIQYSFTVGEMAISTLQNGKIITQGFLQPENFIPCKVFTLVAYPNPVAEELHFRFEGCDDKVGRVMLIDVYGKLLLDYDVKEDRLDLSELKTGIYILRAFNPLGKSIGTIKIAKIGKL